MQDQEVLMKSDIFSYAIISQSMLHRTNSYSLEGNKKPNKISLGEAGFSQAKLIALPQDLSEC